MTEDMSPEAQAALTGLGFFVVAWNLLESIIEAGIAKELRVTPVKGSIVTAGLQFKARATVLKGLLQEGGAKNSGAISTLNTIMQRGDRNDLIHGIVRWEGPSLVFHRRKSDGTFRVKELRHTAESLIHLSLEFSDLSQKLMDQLGVSDEDYRAFLHKSHVRALSSENARSKARTSKAKPRLTSRT